MDELEFVSTHIDKRMRIILDEFEGIEEYWKHTEDYDRYLSNLLNCLKEEKGKNLMELHLCTVRLITLCQKYFFTKGFIEGVSVVNPR